MLVGGMAGIILAAVLCALVGWVESKEKCGPVTARVGQSPSEEGASEVKPCGIELPVLYVAVKVLDEKCNPVARARIYYQQDNMDCGGEDLTAENGEFVMQLVQQDPNTKFTVAIRVASEDHPALFTHLYIQPEGLEIKKKLQTLTIVIPIDSNSAKFDIVLPSKQSRNKREIKRNWGDFEASWLDRKDKRSKMEAQPRDMDKRIWKYANTRWLKREWPQQSSLAWLKRSNDGLDMDKRIWSKANSRWLKRSGFDDGSMAWLKRNYHFQPMNEDVDWLEKRMWGNANSKWLKKRSVSRSKREAEAPNTASETMPEEPVEEKKWGQDMSWIKRDPSKKWGEDMSWVKKWGNDMAWMKKKLGQDMSWIKRNGDKKWSQDIAWIKRNGDKKWGQDMAWIKRGDKKWGDDMSWMKRNGDKKWGQDMSWIKRGSDKKWGDDMNWMKRNADKKWGQDMAWIKRNGDKKWGQDMAWIKRNGDKKWGDDMSWMKREGADKKWVQDMAWIKRNGDKKWGQDMAWIRKRSNDQSSQSFHPLKVATGEQKKWGNDMSRMKKNGDKKWGDDMSWMKKNDINGKHKKFNSDMEWMKRDHSKEEGSKVDKKDKKWGEDMSWVKKKDQNTSKNKKVWGIASEESKDKKSADTKSS